MWNVKLWYWDTMLSTQGQCQGCPFWCYSTQNEATWRGSHVQQNRNFTSSGGKSGWNWLKFLQKNPDPLAHHFHRDSLPRPSGAMSKHAKTLCLGWEVARFGEATKKEQLGDNLTGKQNSSTTVGTWRLGMAAFSETSNLDPFSHYCWD